MEVLLKRTGQAPKLVTFENTMTNIQNFVGGYYRQVNLGKGVCMVVNEDGQPLGLPANFRLGNDMIVGDVFFCCYQNGEELGSIEESQVNILMTKLFKDSLV